jgi:hypothetical protein
MLQSFRSNLSDVNEAPSHRAPDNLIRAAQQHDPTAQLPFQMKIRPQIREDEGDQHLINSVKQLNINVNRFHIKDKAPVNFNMQRHRPNRRAGYLFIHSEPRRGDSFFDPQSNRLPLPQLQIPVVPPAVPAQAERQ